MNKLFFHAFSDVLFIWSQLWNRLGKLFYRLAQKTWWRILHTDFCAKCLKNWRWQSFVSRWHCHPIYLLLLTCWCREPCLRWSDFQDLEIFRDFQRFSRFIFRSMSEYESSFKMSKSFIVFNSFAINTSKLLEYKQFEFLNSDLCQIESSSQQNVIISTVFQVSHIFFISSL